MGKAGSIEHPVEQVLRDHIQTKDSELPVRRDILGTRAAIRNKEHLRPLPVEQLLFIKVRFCVVCGLVAEQMSKRSPWTSLSGGSRLLPSPSVGKLTFQLVPSCNYSSVGKL